MKTLDDRTRRVIAARHRDRDWEAEVAALYKSDSLFQSLSLLREGYGELTPFLLPRREGERVRSRADEEREIYDWHETQCRERLALLIEARPEAGRALVAPWEAWWAKLRGDH